MVMTMRLIDGDSLFNELDALSWYDNADRDEIALPEIDKASTIDAVLVVRCKDCINSKITDRGKRYCSAPLGMYGATPVNDDDFCSHGVAIGGDT